MPITKKDFEEGNFKTYRGVALKVSEFLKSNKENAYTSKEVAEALGVSTGGVSVALRNLVKANLVDAKKPYYMLKGISSKKKPATTAKKDEESEEELTEEVEEE